MVQGKQARARKAYKKVKDGGVHEKELKYEISGEMEHITTSRGRYLYRTSSNRQGLGRSQTCWYGGSIGT